jgi:hypothetical protein
MTEYIKKLRAGRVANANVHTWIGEPGTLFYNESIGTLRLADGVTPGGLGIAYTVATSTVIGGIKAGPGVVIANDGTLTINSAGLPISFGDFSSYVANGAAVLTTVNTNEDMNLQTNGSGNVQIVGNLHVHPTGAGGLTSEPIFQVKSDGQIRMLVPGADSAEGAVAIIGSATGGQQSPVQTGVMLHITGQLNDASRVYVDAANSYPVIAGRRYNGTASSPTAVAKDDILMRYGCNAYNGTAWNTGGVARIQYNAIENHTALANGTNIEFYVTPIGANAMSKVATIDYANGAVISKATIQGNLTVNGNFIGNSVTTSAIIGTANVSTLNVTNLISTVDGMSVGANLTVGGTANITGQVTTIDGVRVGGDLTVSGNIYYNGAINNATVTQTGTTKNVPVTCNGRSGQITTNSGNIPRNASVTFSMYNNYITSSKDVVVTCIASGATINSYSIAVTDIKSAAHYANITLTNNGGGALTDVLVINFALISIQ